MWPTLLESWKHLDTSLWLYKLRNGWPLYLPTCRGQQCETSFRTQDAMHFGDLQRGGHYYCAIEACPAGNNWRPKPWLVLCRSVAESVLVGTASFAACERGAKKSNMPLWSLPCVLSRFILKAKGVYSSTNWLLYLYVCIMVVHSFLWTVCVRLSYRSSVSQSSCSFRGSRQSSQIHHWPSGLGVCQTTLQRLAWSRLHLSSRFFMNVDMRQMKDTMMKGKQVVYRW